MADRPTDERDVPQNGRWLTSGAVRTPTSKLATVTTRRPHGVTSPPPPLPSVQRTRGSESARTLSLRVRHPSVRPSGPPPSRWIRLAAGRVAVAWPPSVTSLSSISFFLLRRPSHLPRFVLLCPPSSLLSLLSTSSGHSCESERLAGRAACSHASHRIRSRSGL